MLAKIIPKKVLNKFFNEKNIFVVVILFIMIMLYNILLGENNIKKYFTIQSKINDINQKIEIIGVKKLKIQNRIDLLNPLSFDLDYLDQQARKILGLHKKNEIVIVPKN